MAIDRNARKGDRHLEAVTLLRGMILSGELAPGEPLRELTFSQQFNMSRTPVREAFRTLAAEGLVTLLLNRTVQVAPLDGDDASDVLVVLAALESLAARLACVRLTNDQVKLFEAAQKDLECHCRAGNRTHYLEASRRLHEQLVEGAANPTLLLAWRLLMPRAERARHLGTLDPNRWQEASAELQRICAALVDRDGACIGQLVEEHFAKGARDIQSALKRARTRARWQSFDATAPETDSGE